MLRVSSEHAPSNLQLLRSGGGRRRGPRSHSLSPQLCPKPSASSPWRWACCWPCPSDTPARSPSVPRSPASPTSRPRSTDLEEARKFYTGVVGFAEAFTTKDPAVEGDLVAFKVNDTQFVEVSPTLKGDEDRLIRIGFETADARGLRDYLAAKGVEVPAKVDTDANGNRSFVVKDPDGHAIQFVQYMNGLGAREGQRQAPLAHPHLRPHPARRAAGEGRRQGRRLLQGHPRLPPAVEGRSARRRLPVDLDDGAGRLRLARVHGAAREAHAAAARRDAPLLPRDARTSRSCTRTSSPAATRRRTRRRSTPATAAG